MRRGEESTERLWGGSGAWDDARGRTRFGKTTRVAAAGRSGAVRDGRERDSSCFIGPGTHSAAVVTRNNNCTRRAARKANQSERVWKEGHAHLQNRASRGKSHKWKGGGKKKKRKRASKEQPARRETAVGGGRDTGSQRHGAETTGGQKRGPARLCCGRDEKRKRAPKWLFTEDANELLFRSSWRSRRKREEGKAVELFSLGVVVAVSAHEREKSCCHRCWGRNERKTTRGN